MAKKKREGEKEMTLLEKAKSHAVKKQSKKPVGEDELEVYVAWANGLITSSQACFALNIAIATFRGNCGTTLRNAIVAGKLEPIEEA